MAPRATGDSRRGKGRKKKVVAVSGGFDPLHIGHIRMFKEAREHGDRLVVIMNNDNWLRHKKGFVFMPEAERKELLLALRDVDEVIVTEHPEIVQDRSVSEALVALRPDVFANGGDRTEDNIPEVEVCRSIGCAMVFGVGRGGKIQSSSWLTSRRPPVEGAASTHGSPKKRNKGRGVGKRRK